MSYKRNRVKEEWLERCGVTAGLPLFEPGSANNIGDCEPPVAVKLPDWIWSGIDIRAGIYNTMKEKFAEDSLIYLNAIIRLGGSATDHQVKDYMNDPDKWALHIVSARRNYFVGDPYYIITSFPDKTTLGPRGKPNTIWYVDFKQLYKLITEEK